MNPIGRQETFESQAFTQAPIIWIPPLVAGLYAIAVFFDGAYFIGAMTFCVVGVWMALAFSSYINLERLSAFRSPAIYVPVLLLTAFWLWNGLSFFWTISRDQTWTEFNRTGGYLAVFMLGIIVGQQGAARRIWARLYLWISIAAATYGVGAKALPSVIDNLNNLGRLSVPIGYVNAQGLLVAMAYPVALYFTVSKREHPLTRLSAALGSVPLLLCLFFTVSRGAIIALLTGLVVYFAFSPMRLRSFAGLILTLTPTVIISWWSSAQEPLMQNNVAYELRIEAAEPLRIYLAVALIAVAAIMILALASGKRLVVSRNITRATGAFVLAAVVATATLSAGWFVASKPSFVDWVNEIRDESRNSQESDSGAARLLNVGSFVRWRLWREAMENWEENVVMGSGAQTFPQTHLLRQNARMAFVKQPHGLPFRLLSELGAVGMALMAAYISITCGVAARMVKGVGVRDERAMAAAFLALMVTYLIHTAFDWDWNMFALTLPYFFFAGICAGWYAAIHQQE